MSRSSTIVSFVRLASAASSRIDETDDTLLARFAADADESAFAELVRRHGPLVRGTAHRMVGDPHLADDVFQAVFLLLAQKAGRIKWGHTVGPWLYAATVRIARKALRTRKTVAVRANANRKLHDDPLHQADRKEVAYAVDFELALLPERLRDPLILCYLDGKTRDEAASLLGWTLATLKRRLDSGRKILRNRLTQRGLSLCTVGIGLILSESHIDATLIQLTASAATNFALTGVAKPAIMALLSGFDAMKRVLVTIAALAVASIGFGFAAASPDEPPQPKQPTPQVTPVAPPKPAVDSSLPAGAVMRLGETRFRPGSRISRLEFSPDGTKLASWGNWLYFEDRLSIWDVATGKERSTSSTSENEIAAFTWAKDGRGWAVMKPSVQPSQSAFRVVNWDDAIPNFTAPKGMGNRVINPATKDDVTFIAFDVSRDGKRLAALRSDGKQSFIDVWELKATKTGDDLNRLHSFGPLPASTAIELKMMPNDRVMLVTGKAEKSTDIAVTVWNTNEGGLIGGPTTLSLGGPISDWNPLDVNAEGSRLAVGLKDGSAKVFDLTQSKETVTAKKHGPWQGKSPFSDVCAVKFVNNGQRVLTAGVDGKQVVWDARTGETVADLNGHSSWVQAIAESADGKLAATAGQDSLIRTWDAKTWKPLSQPEGHRDSVWRLETSRDGRYAMSCGTQTIIWEMTTGQSVRQLTNCNHEGGYARFAPDSKGVVIGAKDQPARLHVLAEHESKPLDITGQLLAFSPDGKTLLTTTKGQIAIWDWPMGKKRAAVPVKGEPISAAISPDSLTALIGYSSNGSGATVIDLKEGTKVNDLVFKLKWFSEQAAFSADGRTVSGATSDGPVEVWSLKTNALERKFESAIQKRPGIFYPNSYVVSADGRKAAVAMSDGGATVFETASGQVITSFHGHREGLVAVAFTPDGNRLLTGGGDHQVLVWDVSPSALAKPTSFSSDAELAKAWATLGTAKAKDAASDIAGMIAKPDLAVAFLKVQIKPIGSVEPATVDRIFKELDSSEFETRDKANRDLNALGESAVGIVREKVKQVTSAEVRRKAETFVSQFESTQLVRDRLRETRGLAALEAIATSDAIQMLTELSQGAKGAWLTEEASRIVVRMKSKP